MKSHVYFFCFNILTFPQSTTDWENSKDKAVTYHFSSEYSQSQPQKNQYEQHP